MNHVLRPKAADLRLGLGASLLSLRWSPVPAGRDHDRRQRRHGRRQPEFAQTAGPQRSGVAAGWSPAAEAAALRPLSAFPSAWCMRGHRCARRIVASEDLSALTSAALFRQGEVTPVFVRFSTVIGGSGSPETSRDPRGFSTKFYTREGNWDLVGNHLPVFFIRDAIKFPDVIHSLSRRPPPTCRTERTFDFFARVPEATHADPAVLRLRNAGQLPPHGRFQRACLPSWSTPVARCTTCVSTGNRCRA